MNRELYNRNIQILPPEKHKENLISCRVLSALQQFDKDVDSAILRVSAALHRIEILLWELNVEISLARANFASQRVQEDAYRDL